MAIPRTSASSVFGVSTFIRIFKQRFVALFLFALFASSSVIALAPVQAWAAAKSSNTTPRPLAVTSSQYAPAADISQANNKIKSAAGLSSPGSKSPQLKAGEMTDKRTPTSTTTRNTDGTLTEKQYLTPQFYQKDNSLQPVDTTLVEDTNAGDAGTGIGKLFGKVESAFSSATTYTVKDNDWQARFAPSDFGAGMIRVQKGSQQIGFLPVNANKVKPTITTVDGKQFVRYTNLWNGVDVEYSVYSTRLKENIIFKNKEAQAQVAFTIVGGARLEPGKPGDAQAPAYAIKGVLNDEFSIAQANLILNQFGLVTDSSVFKQAYADGKIMVSIDSNYLQHLPEAAFPAVVDPGLDHSTFGNRAGGNYVSLKSDGYVCYSNVCNPYAGSLQDSDGAWRSWRTAFFAPYDGLKDKGRVLTNANLHLAQRTGASFWTGTYDNRYVEAWRTTCNNNYNCLDRNLYGGNTLMGTLGNIDVTALYQNRVANSDFGMWLGVSGEEGQYVSYKNLDPDNSYIDFTWKDVPPIPAITSPVDSQVFVDPQVSFTANTMNNPNSSSALKYNFCVSNSSGCSGVVMSSGDITSPQWTIPDGVLQDGSTYYAQARTLDPDGGGGYSQYSAGVPFKIDARTGKDKTQTYDTLGPVSVDLATGNVSASASSHTTSALGGSIGVGLDYNSPLRSRQGLVGEYWNNDSLNGTPALMRTDQNIDFSWGNGSPSDGTIPADNFSARWTGYFVAPQTGTYQFGSDVDDGCRIWANNQLLVDNWTWCGGQYGAGISLTAGQIIPIRMEYREGGGYAIARLLVKGTVSTGGMAVPATWLQTGVRATSQQNGLVGHYYNDDGTHDFTKNTTMFLQRTDPLLSFNWGAGGAVPGAPADHFLVRWTGYLTVPTTGDYQFGSVSDDGTRITIGAANQVAFDKWHDDGGIEGYGGNIHLTAGQSVPITVDYFENGGGADMFLKVQGAVPNQIVPTNWLSPKAQVLPVGWNMGVDPDGNVGYDHLRATASSVVLSDSSGDTHEYTWTSGNNYKPPVNEDGVLIKNDDGTYKLQDTDGRTYVFNSAGLLDSLTSPVDDRKPAALQYTYGGTPSRLTQIKDGVDPTRNASVYYAGDSNCGALPTGFDATPTGMLCSVKTNDGRATYFYYSAGQLARIVAPGNETTDFGYDSFGRIVSVRDSATNDAIAAGVRAQDDQALSQISYDALGRATGVTRPAATAGATRIQHTVDYANTSLAWRDNTTVPDSVAGRVVATSWGANRMDLFARGSSNDLIHRWWDGTNWSAWESLGGCIKNDPGAAAWETGRIDVVAEGCDSTGANIYHKWYGGGAWQAWENIGGRTENSPIVTSWGPLRLDVMVVNTGNGLSHKIYDPALGGWTSWGGASSGCISGAPTATTADGRIDVFAKDCTATGNNLLHYSFTQATGWSAVSTLPVHIDSVPSATLLEPGKSEVFTTDSVGTVYRTTYAQSSNQVSSKTTVPGSCSAVVPAALSRNVGIDLLGRNCTTPTSMQWQRYAMPFGTSTEHIVGAPEPNGFTQRVEYDNLFRTTKDTDLSNLSTISEWDAAKDLAYSTTDPTGLKSTTIYDDDDRPTDQYGAAPSSWFGTDRKPLATTASQVPHTNTTYDQGMVGPQVAWYSASSTTGSLLGAPKAHTTGINPSGDTSWLGRNFSTTPIPAEYNLGTDYGLSATAKIRFPQSGTYTLRLSHDDGARVSVNDQLIVDDWQHRSEGTAQMTNTGTFTAEAGKAYRFRLDYAHFGNPGVFELWVTGPGIPITDATNQLGTSHPTFVTPDYELTTSTTIYDASLGNTTSTTSYGGNPELGLAASNTLDPSGLNLTNTMSYEQQGAAGSYLRQTSKTLPGGETTNYNYYSATETADNPCTPTVEAYRQGGMQKGKTEPDPDGTGPQTGRTTTTIYDDSGKVVATRYNSDPWTCTTYDARERVSQTVVPSVNGQPARTITNDYAVGGNPLKTSSTDNTGAITTEVDLLGRTISYTDATGNTTTSTYNNLSQLTDRNGPLGHESFTYDNLGRLTAQLLDSTTVAVPQYDQYNRVSTVSYPSANNMRLTYTRDIMGHTSSMVYTNSSGATLASDQVTYTQSGQIVGGIQNGAAKAYTYDKATRLVGATIGSNAYAYGFGAQDTPCGSGANTNPNSGKSGNRTSQTVDGVSTTYCYDNADRLTSSSNPLYTADTYDAHGNLTSIGSGAVVTTFGYDSSNRNSNATETRTTGIAPTATTATTTVTYARDVQSRVTARTTKLNTTVQSDVRYGFTGSGDTPDFVQKTDGTVLEKYLSLTGNVNLTIRPAQTGNSQKVYSLPNIHGDIMATTDAVGTITAQTMTGPFGETIPGQVAPSNTVADSSYSYVGQHEKLTESTLALGPIQMGARVYLPGIGRFAQVDPIEGGTENNYAYPNDPVNDFDLAGTNRASDWMSRKWWQAKSHITDRHKRIDTEMSMAGALTTVRSMQLGTVGFASAPALSAAFINLGASAHMQSASDKSRGRAYWTQRSASNFAKGAGCGLVMGRGCLPGTISPAKGSLLRKVYTTMFKYVRR